MKLYQRAFEFSISVIHDELMNSHMHGPEDALHNLGGTAQVVVAELVPTVVK